MSDDFTIRGASSENILTLLIWHDQYAITIVDMIGHDATIFADRNQEHIAEAAIRYIDFHNRAPKHHIKDLLEADLRRPGGNSDFLMHLIDSSERVKDELDPDYVMSEADKFIRI